VRTSAWRVPVAVTRVYLSVEVDRHADDITKALGCKPSEARRYRNVLLQRDLTQWKLDLAAGPFAHEVVRQATDRLLELGEDLARRIARLNADDPDVVAMVIAQHVSTDPRTTGFELSSALIQWLAAAGAAIAIDQDVWDRDGPEGEIAPA